MKRIIYAWISKKFMNGCSDYNSLEVRRSCRSKAQARHLFAQNNIPHAKGEVFFSPFKAFQFVKQYGFPVIVKPNVSGYSRGAYFPINNKWELLKACILVKKWWPSSIIEQYLLGRNYRIVITKWGVMSVIQRYPPNITGDGQCTITELIDQENHTREKMNLFPAIFPIQKNSLIKKYLKKQNLHLDSILEKGKCINVYNKVALKPGGIVEIVDKKLISNNNLKDLQAFLKACDASILGLDVICQEGVWVDFHKQPCIFLEINSRPYLKMHEYPRIGQKEDLTYYYDKLNQLEVEGKGTF